MMSSLLYVQGEREIGVHSDEGKPIRMHTTVSSTRVNHYSDVVGFMMRDASQKFVLKHNRQPSDRELKAFEREALRAIHFDRNLDKASKLEIKPIELLKG